MSPGESLFFIRSILLYILLILELCPYDSIKRRFIKVLLEANVQKLWILVTLDRVLVYIFYEPLYSYSASLGRVKFPIVIFFCHQFAYRD